MNPPFKHVITFSTVVLWSYMTSTLNKTKENIIIYNIYIYIYIIYYIYNVMEIIKK
jgi:hypothetical protein